MNEKDEVFEAGIKVRVGAEGGQLCEMRVIKMSISAHLRQRDPGVIELASTYTRNNLLKMFFTIESKSFGNGTPIFDGKMISSSSCFCTHWKRKST